MKTLFGTVLNKNSGLFEILTEQGERLFANAKGILRHRGQTLLAGDRVSVETAEDQGAVISEIFPRKNAFLRPAIANLGALILVFSVKNPAPVPLFVDQLLAIAEHANIKIAIAITKADLSPVDSQSIRAIYADIGYPLFVCDCHGAGTDELRSFLKKECADKTIAFSGSSGVGKSTLMNRLFPQLQLQVGETSQKTERGKHTTRQVQLFPLATLWDDKDASGFIADTPGFSLLDFEAFDFFTIKDLPQTFVEFIPFYSDCRYQDCTHTKEADCGVAQAIRAGKIHVSRHDSYIRLYEILKSKKAWGSK